MDKACVEKARLYALRHRLTIGGQLGSGHHGSVFVAARNTHPNRSAIKFHKEQEPYLRERKAYERLAERGITEIEGFAVPILLNADDELLVLEMTIVERPFLLDFGGAYLERPPEFPDNVWEEWREQKAEQFGSNWPVVEDVLTTLHCMGIHMLDVHPKNIAFLDDVD
jgi:hypothetical protein